MSAVIPGFFMVLGAAGLLMALFFLWQSVRAALGVVQLGGAESLDRERARLLERKAALLDGLADLRFEHDAGKIDAADFAVVDAQLREEAKDVLKALDEELEPYRGQADAVIEAYLAGSSLESVAPADLLAATKPSPSLPVAGAASSCPTCHTVNDADAVFCKKCGGALGEAPSESGKKS